MNLQAVLFDLDGVITDTAEYHFQAWKQMAANIGIAIDRDFNETLKGISRMESLERILTHGKCEHRFTMEDRIALAKEKNDHYVSLLANLSPNDTYPGIWELLVKLQENQIPAVVASASKNAPQILKSLCLGELFQVVVNPDGIPGKPAPDIFLKGARAVGADPAYCIGIEDAQAGIQAIRAAGMYAIGIGDKELLIAAGAQSVHPDTSTLNFDLLLEVI